MKTLIIMVGAAILAYATMFGITYSAMSTLCPDTYEMTLMGGQCTWTISRSYDESITMPEEEGTYDLRISLTDEGVITEFIKQ